MGAGSCPAPARDSQIGESCILSDALLEQVDKLNTGADVTRSLATCEPVLVGRNRYVKGG